MYGVFLSHFCDFFLASISIALLSLLFFFRKLLIYSPFVVFVVVDVDVDGVRLLLFAQYYVISKLLRSPSHRSTRRYEESNKLERLPGE